VQALKGFGLWVGGAFVALVLMYMFGAGRENPASVAFIGYIIWWGIQGFGLSTQAARWGWDEGRLSNAGGYIREIFRRLIPVYLGVTALLLFDSIFNTRLGSNWLTFAASVVVGLYLLRRDVSRTQARGLLRGGQANVAPISRATGATTRSKYAEVEVEDSPAPDMSATWTQQGAAEFDQWLGEQKKQGTPPAAPKRSKYDTEE